MRSAVILMPFGGNDKKASDRSYLEFMRVRHLLQINYPDMDVDRCLTRYQHIAANALEKIRAADLAVAIIDEINYNVIYEIGYRMGMNARIIMLVSPEKTHDELPIYLKGLGHINYDIDPSVQRKINELVETGIPESEDDPEYEAFYNLIKKNESRFSKILKDTLNEVPVPSVNDEGTSSSLPRSSFWADYFNYPAAVIRIDWKCQKSKFTYREDDLLRSPVYHEANTRFVELFELTDAQIEKLDQKELPVNEAIEHLKCMMEPNHAAEFDLDQKMISKDIIFRRSANRDKGMARVPIRLKSPVGGIREFWPCIFGRYIDPTSNLSDPHSLYLIVVYLELGVHELKPLIPPTSAM